MDIFSDINPLEVAQQVRIIERLIQEMKESKQEITQLLGEPREEGDFEQEYKEFLELIERCIEVSERVFTTIQEPNTTLDDKLKYFGYLNLKYNYLLTKMELLFELLGN